MNNLLTCLVKIISETNGITLIDTLELALVQSNRYSPDVCKHITEFRNLLYDFKQKRCQLKDLLVHPVSQALYRFFQSFPVPFRDEHIHLTGSLSAEFLWPHLQKLMIGENQKLYQEKIESIYGVENWPIRNEEHLQQLIELAPGEKFARYLQILFLPKLILTSREMHRESAYHMAKRLYSKFNVGFIRLKFTLSRTTAIQAEQIPGHASLTSEDVVLGLYEGLNSFKKECPNFNFVLSPCFRKEKDFFDKANFSSKEEHVLHQVEEILQLLEKFPQLQNVLCDVDTVGDERDFYRKSHFAQMKKGLRKLQYRGLAIRSHHGETWHTLRKGIQAIDNALNSWQINTLEHGLGLGINPNFYFHSLYQKIMQENEAGLALQPESRAYKEIQEMPFRDASLQKKILVGQRLSVREHKEFLQTKFHTARELEHYQHDVLNLMIRKNVGVTALPSSNQRLTGLFSEYKDHPFSWWEKKGLQLGIGVDNDITLQTDYIQELLIVLYTDAENLKLTKLLKVATGEHRRPYLSHLLWEMRSALEQDSAQV